MKTLARSGAPTSLAPLNNVAVCFLIALTSLLAVAAGPCLAQSPAPKDFTPKVRHSVLMDGETGGILYRHNSDELIAPASMSKLMTLAVAFKLMKAGKIKPSDEFVMSVNAWRKGGAPSGTSAMMVPVNTKVRLDELLQGVIVQSGNDASMAIAEGIAGSEEAFVRLMTQEARQLGLNKAQFRNSTGLFHPEHLMTVRELAVLARHIVKEYPDYFPLFAQKEFLYRRHKFTNRNPMLALDTNIDGMKTGYLKQSGYGIVVTAKVNGRRLIAVVAGASSESERREEVRRMLDWGSTNISEFKLYDASEVIGRARVFGGSALYVPLVGNGDINVWLPRSLTAQRLRGEIIYEGPLRAPVKKGTEVARLRVTSASNAMQEVPLYAAEDVGEGGMLRRGFDSLAYMAFGLFR